MRRALESLQQEERKRGERKTRCVTAIIKMNGSFALANELHARVPRQFRGSAQLNCHYEFKKNNLFSECHFEKVMLFQNQFKSHLLLLSRTNFSKLKTHNFQSISGKATWPPGPMLQHTSKLALEQAPTWPFNTIASVRGRTNFYHCVTPISRERWVGLRGCENLCEPHFPRSYPLLLTRVPRRRRKTWWRKLFQFYSGKSRTTFFVSGKEKEQGKLRCRSRTFKGL